jgi:hypothetical protein
MSVKSILMALCILALGATLAPAADAQAPTRHAAPEAAPTARPLKTFKLQHESANAAQDLDVEDEEQEAWVPGIRPGTVELSMSLGFMNLSSTLLEHEQMIYKYTTESTYWGDVKIKGQTAFNPVIRMGYNLKPWLTLEGFAGLSISEYSSTIENRRERKNEAGAVPDEDPPLGDFDAEARSLITLQTGVDALIYPFNFSGDGGGRWHPYLTGQVGKIWYDMNSDFTAGAAGSNDIAFGGGLRLLAERNVSIRLEATYHMNSIEFKPAEYFLETDEGTTLVPLVEYPVLEGGAFDERQITSFATEDISYLVWSLGFQGSF